MSDRLIELTASELAPRLARRELSAEALLRACLERIEMREPEVRAWVCLDPDAALDHARMLDRGAVRGLLHGLPLGVKDIFDTFDFPTECGTAIHAGHRPDTDAACVAAAREAGAVIVGKTVTTELANFNPGKTRNPHRLTHTPGGSSSGSAAAVADRMVPLALGSQTAGSIVRPAGYCGVVGYKPSFGRIVRAGVKSLSETLDTLGCLARSVPDAALCVAALTGDERLRDLDTHRVPRFGLCRTHEWDKADVDTRVALDTAARGLTAAGARVGEVALPVDFAPLAAVQARIMGYEMARNLADERIRHGDRLSPVLAGVLADGMKLKPWDHEADVAAAFAARARAAELFGDCDVLIAPSTTGEAPEGHAFTGDPVFGRVWTLLGLPCVHVPFTSGASGMPVGLQVVGRPGADLQVLSAAHWMHTRLAG